MQQAPVGSGSGHVWALQGTLAPSQVNVQAAWVVIVQALVAVLQQAPSPAGTGQV